MARMIRRFLLGGVVVTAGLVSVTVHAGGWGVITVKTLPDYFEVGRPTQIAFSVKGHGQTLAPGLKGSVEAVSGGAQIVTPIEPGNDAGHYHATLVLPREGDWVLTINAGYRVTLLPVRAVGVGVAPPTVTAEERGRRLFVAKGCVTCHQNDLDTGNPSSTVGPVLVAGKYQPAFLSRMLADPAALIPPRPESYVRMPDLQLDAQEIASLVAFIDAPRATAARR
jgi:hypothetical protein